MSREIQYLNIPCVTNWVVPLWSRVKILNLKCTYIF